MRFIYLVIITLISFTGLLAQKENHFNLRFGGGLGYFFNDKSTDRYINHTKLVGINYEFINKNQHLSFNPGLNIQNNAYISRISDEVNAHVNQNVLNLNLEVLMKISKRSFFRFGLVFNTVFLRNIFISQSMHNANGYYSYGTDQLYEGYHEESIQAGFTCGLSIPFKLFKHQNKFSIQALQLVSGIVSSDFNLDKTLVYKDVKILSYKAKPTCFTIGLDFNLKKNKNKKKIDEE